ncbi:hypothetical protein GCM10010992_07130 [Cloacibacterium rupense]|uniref:Cardiolipin synthase N-terminal domain-containing protein n=1 Tax=Cloacibacterium rupense TaxID=517423 RepID=A0ABQ2NHN0_9FLAO|nr:hypothetical protein [Cloacibacterium rupense]GGP02500.1 hypothetical protein GCM10010992_07130 [Cloacibacterium rupense]
MDAIKKILGIVWLALAAAVAYFGLTVLGIPKITSEKQEDLVFGIIIVFILMPIVVGGLAVFGWYSLNGEYSANKK